MKTVNVEASVTGLAPEQIYPVLCNFEMYAELCSAVRSVQVEEEGDDQLVSSWEVNFQTGVLKWKERDLFDHQNKEIRFHQIAGDIDAFSGTWRVTQGDGASRINFDASFDLGIPMLSDMLDPVAAGAIRDNIRQIIGSLFAANDVTFLPE